MTAHSMGHSFSTILFDLDGTLYEEERIYDRYAEELTRLMPESRRRAFLADWTAVKSGQSEFRVGRGYDVERGHLFTHSSGRITGYLDQEGASPAAESLAEGEPGDIRFGTARMNIGDFWGILAALAAHHGLQHPERQTAFAATRAHMSSNQGKLAADEGLRELLRSLRKGGKRLIAMSNSPADTVRDTFAQLGIQDCFSQIMADSDKPAGLIAFLASAANVGQILSMGDNFVNDIEPALNAGAQALYIDRHRTALGSDREGCYLVPSISAAREWLLTCR
ncbi:MAG: HAD family hydrolase [Chloroflexota bacterium]